MGTITLFFISITFVVVSISILLVPPTFQNDLVLLIPNEEVQVVPFLKYISDVAVSDSFEQFIFICWFIELLLFISIILPVIVSLLVKIPSTLSVVTFNGLNIVIFVLSDVAVVVPPITIILVPPTFQKALLFVTPNEEKTFPSTGKYLLKDISALVVGSVLIVDSIDIWLSVKVDSLIIILLTSIVLAVIRPTTFKVFVISISTTLRVVAVIVGALKLLVIVILNGSVVPICIISVPPTFQNELISATPNEQVTFPLYSRAVLKIWLSKNISAEDVGVISLHNTVIWELGKDELTICSLSAVILAAVKRPVATPLELFILLSSVSTIFIVLVTEAEVRITFILLYNIILLLLLDLILSRLILGTTKLFDIVIINVSVSIKILLVPPTFQNDLVLFTPNLHIDAKL